MEDGGAIATGRYSESIINDAKAARIGREARPLFDEEKYYDGFSQILVSLNTEITKDVPINSTATGGQKDFSFNNFIIIFFVGILVLIIIAKIFSSMDGIGYSGSGGFSSGSSGSGVSFGSGGFSGGSFGGGGGKF